MGIEYYLVNTKDKTFYDLGKFTSDLVDEIDCLFDVQLLEIFLQDDLEFLEAYSKELAIELFNFVNGATKDQIFILSDCSDGILYVKAMKYKYVGTRYRNSDGSVVNFGDENKHLEDKWYDRLYEPNLELYASLHNKSYKL